MQPAVAVNRSSGRLGHIEIAVHDVIPARTAFADFADSGDVSGLEADDLRFHIRHRWPDRVGFIFDRVARLGHRRDR